MNVVNNILDRVVVRNIAAWSQTLGRKNFQSSATTYGQLKRDLQSQGFSLENVRVTEGNTQLDLVNEDAILPTNMNVRGQITNDLIIVMTPNRNIKSGNEMSYKELKEAIKKLFNSKEYKQSAKIHFGNYTQLSTIKMRTLYTSWCEKNVEKPNAAKEELQKIQEILDTENTSILSNIGSIDYNEYQEALQYITFGIELLQNCINKFKITTDISDEEFEKVLKKIK